MTPSPVATSGVLRSGGLNSAPFAHNFAFRVRQPSAVAVRS
ncbi:hypothetical protein ACH4VR_19215 [Streptomyces sp. NPDC020883]|nr:hypothetical protein [Streptomyces sp. BHT-5-2]